MATSATTFFGNRVRAAVVVAGGTPALADLFTVDRGFEGEFGYEVAELFGTDSIFRVDEAKYMFKPIAKLKGCKFDPGTSAATGIWKHILNTLNGAASGTGTVADTNNMYLMDVYMYITGSAAPTDNKVCVKITNAYMSGPTIPFPENEFVILDLEFHGRTGTITNDAVPTS